MNTNQQTACPHTYDAHCRDCVQREAMKNSIEVDQLNRDRIQGIRSRQAGRDGPHVDMFPSGYPERARARALDMAIGGEE